MVSLNKDLPVAARYIGHDVAALPADDHTPANQNDSAPLAPQAGAGVSALAEPTMVALGPLLTSWRRAVGLESVKNLITLAPLPPNATFTALKNQAFYHTSALANLRGPQGGPLTVEIFIDHGPRDGRDAVVRVRARLLEARGAASCPVPVDLAQTMTLSLFAAKDGRPLGEYPLAWCLLDDGAGARPGFGICFDDPSLRDVCDTYCGQTPGSRTWRTFKAVLSVRLRAGYRPVEFEFRTNDLPACDEPAP